jgi:hypothetical protein
MIPAMKIIQEYTTAIARFIVLHLSAPFYTTIIDLSRGPTLG